MYQPLRGAPKRHYGRHNDRRSISGLFFVRAAGVSLLVVCNGWNEIVNFFFNLDCRPYPTPLCCVGLLRFSAWKAAANRLAWQNISAFYALGAPHCDVIAAKERLSPSSSFSLQSEHCRVGPENEGFCSPSDVIAAVFSAIYCELQYGFLLFRIGRGLAAMKGYKHRMFPRIVTLTWSLMRVAPHELEAKADVVVLFF